MTTNKNWDEMRAQLAVNIRKSYEQQLQHARQVAYFEARSRAIQIAVDYAVCVFNEPLIKLRMELAQ